MALDRNPEIDRLTPVHRHTDVEYAEWVANVHATLDREYVTEAERHGLAVWDDENRKCVAFLREVTCDECAYGCACEQTDPGCGHDACCGTNPTGTCPAVPAYRWRSARTQARLDLFAQSAR